MSNPSVNRQGLWFLWLLLSASVCFRNPVPIDETRYLSVAWEMWQRGDFWVPYLNGHTYSHKPPLLFWLMHVGWAIFGVNEWWPRLIGPLGALANLLLTRKIAELLWPGDKWVAMASPLVLLATLLWTVFATSTMFDILLTNCVLFAVLGLLWVSHGHDQRGWATFSAAVGLGLLSKGPVIFLHVLPLAIFAPWLTQEAGSRSKHWYIGLTIASVAGLLIALCWAIPAALKGGEDYGSAILWHQTADRTLTHKIHSRPVFWYLLFLPLLLFPWISWAQLWRGARATHFANDFALRFCAAWLLATLIVFSLLPSKQLHYLIPMLPAFALLVAKFIAAADKGPLYQELLPAVLLFVIGLVLMSLPIIPGLDRLQWVQSVKPLWGGVVMATAAALAMWTIHARQLSVFPLAFAVVLAVFVSFIFFFDYSGQGYDLRPAARIIKGYQDQQTPVAFVGNYQGQFNFLARMKEPLTTIEEAEITQWARAHPGGYLVFLSKDKPEHTVYSQLHREHWLYLRAATDFLSIKH